MRLRLPKLILVASLAFAGCQLSAEQPVASADIHTPRDMIRGMTLDASARPSPEHLVRLVDLGVDHVVLIPFGFQRTHDDPNLRFNPNPDWYAESEIGTRELAVAGDSLGFEIIIKPQIWLGRDDDHWSATIGFETEDDWLTWESNYRELILYQARLAQEIESPLFVIGTELSRSVRERPDFWRALIQEIRGVYSGQLTYAANWYDDYEHAAFWDDLDYIGVQAYFPLSDDTSEIAPELLLSAWEPHKLAIQTISERFDKPVLFTEIGYRSVSYAAYEPWRWAERGESAPADTLIQRQLYEAFFDTFWSEEWFEGALFWKWTLRSNRRHGSDRGRLDYSPQNKPAERVLGGRFVPQHD